MTDVELRYTGPAHRYRSRPLGIQVEKGNTITVDAAETVTLNADTDDEDEETLPVPEWLCRDHGFERVESEYPLLDKTIPEIEDTLATGAYDDRLDSLAHAEREGQNRTGALDALADRRDATPDAPEGGDEPPDEGGDSVSESSEA